MSGRSGQGLTSPWLPGVGQYGQGLRQLGPVQSGSGQYQGLSQPGRAQVGSGLPGAGQPGAGQSGPWQSGAGQQDYRPPAWYSKSQDRPT